MKHNGAVDDVKTEVSWFFSVTLPSYFGTYIFLKILSFCNFRETGFA